MTKLKIALLMLTSLSISLGTLYTLSNNHALAIQQNTYTAEISFTNTSAAYVPVTDSGNTIISNISTTEREAVIIDAFLASKNSPLAGQGQNFVAACNRENVAADCYLLIAISYAETKYCTSPGSYDSHNCWGFGGAPPYRMVFGSYKEAIDLITFRLANQYGHWFFTNPRRGARTYCGGGPGCESWAAAVESSFNDIYTFASHQGF